ncbi:MAG: NAD-dependent epimerase/dehydratase family protein [bacterium]
MNETGASSGTLIALTGATGFLGSHVADRLVARGYRVRASVRTTSDLRWLRGKPIETVEISLAPSAPGSQDNQQLDRFLDGVSGVIHCAGVVRAPTESGYIQGNVDTTRALLQAASRQSSCETFLLVSSLAAAGPAPPQTPLVESAPCAPITAYGRSKLAAEELLADPSLQLRTVILRPPALYGPRDSAFLPLFKLARAGWTVKIGHTMAGLSLVDGRDAAAAAVTLLETTSATGPFFVDDGFIHTWADMTAALALAFRRRVRTVTIPWGLLGFLARLVGSQRAQRLPVLHPDRMRDVAAPGWVCSGAKLRQETDWLPQRDLNTGFRETLEFYVRNGWLHAS